MEKVVVLIPAYNEEATIGKVITDFSRVLPHAKIYVYNNNSIDHTESIARKNGAVIKNETRQGKGNVIRRMFREIDAECYIIVDADDTYPAECAAEMADLVLQQNADMVLGDRLSSTYFQENKRPFHNSGNRLVRKTIQILFHTDIKDIMTGYRAFSYEFVKTFPVLSEGFEIETEMTIHAVDKRMNIRSIVIEYRDRPKGSFSKLNTWADGARVIFTIINLFRTYQPMKFFGLVSLILITIASIFFFPILAEYFETGLVPKFPTLIVCCFTAIASTQSLFTGLTLQTILKKNRQDFEVDLNRAASDKRKIKPETMNQN